MLTEYKTRVWLFAAEHVIRCSIGLRSLYDAGGSAGSIMIYIELLSELLGDLIN